MTIRLSRNGRAARLNALANGRCGARADRLWPARAVIRSVPKPASGRRHDAMLLHDGAPDGTRRLHGQKVQVLDALVQRLVAATKEST